MTELSPQAQAVLDAINNTINEAFVTGTPATFAQVSAAALLAATDQVVPEDPEEAMHFTTEAIRLNRMGVRASFLAIAAELEGGTSTSSAHLEIGDE